jgi:hypothetical protein
MYEADERRFNGESVAGPPYKYGCWFDAVSCAVTPPWVDRCSAEAGILGTTLFFLQVLHRTFWAKLNVQLDELIFQKAVNNEKYYYAHMLWHKIDHKKALEEAVAAYNVGFPKSWEKVLLTDAEKVISKIGRHMQSCRCALCRAAKGPAYWKDVVEYPLAWEDPKTGKWLMRPKDYGLWDFRSEVDELEANYDYSRQQKG